MDYAPGPKPVEHSVASYTAGAIGARYASTRSQVGEMVPTSRRSGRTCDGNDSRTWAESPEVDPKTYRPIQQMAGEQPMKWLKLATQGSGWANVVVAIATLAAKSFGFDTFDSAVVPQIIAGLGLIHGGAYIPVPSVAPVMSDLHNKTVDAVYHLDGVLPKNEEINKAIGILWNAVRNVPQEVKK